MGIIDVTSVGALSLKPNTVSSPSQGIDGSSGKNFMNYLKDALNEVNNYQQEASQSALNQAMGNNEYLHNTTIAYEKAILALQLTVEIRNKMVSAYEEIMRMQV
ncbi:flagellar hook-basal body complex protein flie [hydrocarbon metagenome]|uniref:Flagellar hook-basal body complex protein flie n=1 Tax=hydrocarbon metagenome TaxID=938273 RepID=A0A0W8E5F1_9ZZZZ